MVIDRWAWNPNLLARSVTMSKKPVLPPEIKKLKTALSPTVAALRRLAEYELEPSIDRRMQRLGERKEFLGKEEHAELLALVTFAERRTIEKLEAEVALKRLRELMPELVHRRVSAIPEGCAWRSVPCRRLLRVLPASLHGPDRTVSDRPHPPPRSRRRTILKNLALACPHCNARKWAHTHGQDPVSGKSVRLFNPRTQQWSDHFQWSAQNPLCIEGKTATGRVTSAQSEDEPSGDPGHPSTPQEIGRSRRSDELTTWAVSHPLLFQTWNRAGEQPAWWQGLTGRLVLLQQTPDRKASLPYVRLHGTIVMIPQTSLLLVEAWLPAISVCMFAVALALGST